MNVGSFYVELIAYRSHCVAMDKNSNEKGDNQGSIFSIEQQKDNHIDPSVSIHSIQPTTNAPAQDELVVEHTGKESDNLHEREIFSNDLQVPTTKYLTKKYKLTQLAALSSTCECRPTAVKPFRCGLCLKAYSTICQLHEHLEYAHREHEMYLFNKITQTAFPRYESSSVATQTDKEIEQHDSSIADRLEDGFGDAELEVKIPCELLDSAHELDEKEHSERNATGYVKNTDSNYCNFSGSDSEFLNKHEDVAVKIEALFAEDDSEFLDNHEDVAVKMEVISAEGDSEILSDHEDVDVKTKVLSSDDEYTPQGEKRKRLSSKRKKKSGSNTVKRKRGKGKGSKISKKGLKTTHSQTLKTVDDKAKPNTSTSDADKAKPNTSTSDADKDKPKNLTNDCEGTKPKTLATDDSSCLFRCLYCTIEFSSRLLLQRHVNREHRKETQCKICNRQYASRTGLACHLAYRNQDPCKCDKCNKMYTSTCQLICHRKQTHSDVQNIVCGNCGEGFTSESLLYEHHKRCLELRPFSCTFENCDKKFRRNCDLRTHLKTHSGEISHICAVCGKGFFKTDSLRKHMFVHSGERPMQCDKCAWTFPTRGMLLRHMKTHTQDKKHKCHCGKAFTNNWNLKTHARQHTGEKPYVCELCGSQFTHNVSRKKHMKIHTGGV